MAQRITLFFGLLFLITTQATAQTFSLNDPSDLSFSQERLSRVDSFLQSWVEEGKIPYAVSMIVHRRDTVHHQAYGWKDTEKQQPLETDAIFRIASQTKLVTSVAVMMLYEQAEFLLEDPISRYIPAFANARVLETYDSASLEYETRAANREISIRDLLTHTAGIPYDHPLNARPEFDIPFLASTENIVLEEAINRLAKRPLIHEPGAQFTYGPNTDILGRLVEVVSGMTLAEFFQERIFAPLGMNDTYFYLPPDKKDRLVMLYEKESADRLLKVSD